MSEAPASRQACICTVNRNSCKARRRKPLKRRNWGKVERRNGAGREGGGGKAEGGRRGGKAESEKRKAEGGKAEPLKRRNWAEREGAFGAGDVRFSLSAFRLSLFPLCLPGPAGPGFFAFRFSPFAFPPLQLPGPAGPGVRGLSDFEFRISPPHSRPSRAGWGTLGLRWQLFAMALDHLRRN